MDGLTFGRKGRKTRGSFNAGFYGILDNTAVTSSCNLAQCTNQVLDLFNGGNKRHIHYSHLDFENSYIEQLFTEVEVNILRFSPTPR